jgi:glycosyltransferase involved in cell wall biosynthesis
MDKPEGCPNVTILICTLNEEENLPHVLPNIPAWVDEILLIDGHSTDNTVEAAKKICPEIKVLYQPGKGKGDALRYGVREAKGNIVITLDADGETPPTEIGHFIDSLLQGYDFAKGSRLAHGRPVRMPRYRWFGNKVLSFTFNLLYGTKFTDICSGYNAFWKHTFLKLHLTYDTFQMEQQLLARAKKGGLKMSEVIHHSDGRFGGTSKTSGIKQGFIDWFVIISERFHD